MILPNMCEVTLIEKNSDIIPTRRSTRTVVIISHSMMTLKKEELIKSGFYVVIFVSLFVMYYTMLIDIFRMKVIC